MEYRHFGIKVITRVALIFVSLFLLVLAINGEQYYITSAVLILLVIFETIELTLFVNRINRELSHFINAVRLKDYTLNYYPERSGRTFRPLRIALGNVLNDLRNAREKEHVQYLQLQMVVDHIDTGILLYDEDKHLHLLNRTAGLFFPEGATMNTLRVRHRKLAEFIEHAKPGSRELYEITYRDQRIQLALRKSMFKLREQQFKLISLNDIHSELDTKELDAWHKLIRVLTHEIMNSVTPINSLSQSMLWDLKQLESETTEVALSDLILSAETIYSRSRDLMKFISDYKKLTKLKNPEFAEIDLSILLGEVESLFKKDLLREGISISRKESSGSNIVEADREMIMRVLINLMRNAIDASVAVQTPEIKTFLSKKDDAIYLCVSDNGEGITDTVLPEIFVPFFTTRKKGSGIGLSICRQIMHLHGGNIRVKTRPGTGTSFVLRFKTF